MVIELDGSVGEGGGQVLRNAIAIAALLRKRIRVYNIRAKRNPPGLRPQHMTAVKAVAELCGGEVSGLHIGSTEIVLIPGESRGTSYVFDAGTAGSTTLMLQSLLPVMSFAKHRLSVELRGGTNNPLAPPVDYIETVLLPVLSRMGVRANLRLLRRGFYPRGGGIIQVSTEPVKRLSPIELVEVGEVEEVMVYAYSCNLPAHIVDRISKRSEELLRANGVKDVRIVREVLQRGNSKCSLDPGTGVILVARTSAGAVIGSDALGERGVPSEVVANRAVDSLIGQLKYPVDRHLGDQLIIWTALAAGRSRFTVSELTSHTMTSIEVVRSMVHAKFDVDGKLGGPATITCEGIGLTT